MKRVVTVVALVVGLGACHQSEPPREFNERMILGPLTDAELNMLRKDFPGMTAACLKKVRAYGINGMSGVPLDQCFEMTPQRRWTGLWRNAFEGSQFCEKPARECTFDSPGGRVWLTSEVGVGMPVPHGRGGLYAVDFMGRRTLHRGVFGHMGVFDHEIIVDRVISIKQVEAPPPPPTKAEVIEDWKQCEAAGSCIPNWEQINKMEE